MPEISIIIPNYNTEKYLPRLLDSIVHQTFSDIEIILIDDGSTDDSIRIMNTYAKKDPRIKIIKQKNAGPAAARNKGLEAATGQYLMFCDSDDWYEPNMCETMLNTLKKKQADVVCCHTFFDWDEMIGNEEKQKRLVKKYYNPSRSGKYSLTGKNILATNVLLWNKIWRRDLVEQYHIRFPVGHEHDDDAFWYMYAFVADKIFYLKQPLYHYFLRAGSIMSTQANKKPKNKEDRLTICDYVLDFILQHDLKEKYGMTMVQIFKKQLKGARKFLTPEEITNKCTKMNSDIMKKLEIKHCYLHYSAKNNQITLKHKLSFKSLYEWCRFAFNFGGKK